MFHRVSLSPWLKTFIMDNQLKQDHFKVKVKDQEEASQYLQGRGAQINTKNKFLKNEKTKEHIQSSITGAWLPRVFATNASDQSAAGRVLPEFHDSGRGESGAHAQFMVFFAGISLCLTNSVRLVTFGKYEGGIYGCAGCPAGTDHRR